MVSRVEYIWLDGTKPTQQLRCKTKILDLPKKGVSIKDFPIWTFDGSSTNQAKTQDSDLFLIPQRFVPDPLRGENDYLLICEVFDDFDLPHEDDSRANLRNLLEKHDKNLKLWLGFEQEYVLYKNDKPFGWPEEGEPGAQGPYYCSVGADRAFGREIIEEHLAACLYAELYIYGINAEVMPGQWEFQVGPRGFSSEKLNALELCDDLWFARFILMRIAEEYGVWINFDNKPMPGDWNGSGCHTNFSTEKMRNKKHGREEMQLVANKFAKHHKEHIAVYGHGLEKRLTGIHETSDIHHFDIAESNRATALRISKQIQVKGYGYLEDRRPGANADPYQVAARIVETLVS